MKSKLIENAYKEMQVRHAMETEGNGLEEKSNIGLIENAYKEMQVRHAIKIEGSDLEEKSNIWIYQSCNVTCWALLVEALYVYLWRMHI